VSVRLQKYLAEAGLGSRRGCEELIRAGRVTIDGSVAVLGASVDPERQVVLVDGASIVREPHEYWLLNKPAGVLSAAVDTRGRRTVVDCVPSRVRVFPVGRLDLNNTGVLLLTNDGELAARLLHPRYHVEKEYVVTVRGIASEAAMQRLRRGIMLEEGLTAPADVAAISIDRVARDGATTLRVIICEGRKRQVRRMLEAVGHRVVALHRRRFDGLTDTGVALGQARPLSATEVATLRKGAFARRPSAANGGR
jgi:23S rRNA pseudouridine2605 synthase